MTTQVQVPGDGGRRPGLAVVCIALFVVCSALFPNFLSLGNLSAIAQSSALMLIAAMGATALLISGNVDISIGSMFGLVSVVVAITDVATGNAAVAIAVGLLFGGVLGAVNGLIVQVLGIPSLIATLATLAIYRGLAYLISGGHSINDLSPGFTGLVAQPVFGVPVPVIVAGLAALLCAWLLATSVTGLRLFAVGGDRVVAHRLGLRPGLLVVLAFTGNGVLIGLAATLATAVLASGSPTGGVGFEMDVLTAVILGGAVLTGGRGHPVGVLLGVATIGILNAALIFAGLPESTQLIARGTVLLIALAADMVIRRRGRRRAAPAAEPEEPGPGDTDLWLNPAPGDCTLRAHGVSAGFPGVEALVDVDLELVGGEVVCLVGDNGAGKSALIGVLSGVLKPTAGEVVLAGRPVPADPHQARNAGIETAFQRAALCPNLNGLDNLVLGREPRRRLCGVIGIRDLAAARRFAQRGAPLTGLQPGLLHRLASALSGGQQQLLAITRLLRPDARVLLLDEPTAGLGVQQGSAVLRLVRGLAGSGRSVLYVTHDVEEVFEVADRVVVLQRGRVIHDGPLHSLTRLELLALMSGRNRKEADRTLRAVDEERFKIERNLHDGAQQELLHAALMVGVAADRLGDSADPRLVELLRSSKQTIKQALVNLRDISRGIYPTMLASGGLAASLPALARRSPLPVDLRVDVPRLAEDVELVAHFVVAESLTNAAKHADAKQVSVRASHTDGMLEIDVVDDGRGGADETRGTGLGGIRARVHAAAGSLEILSPPGSGTRVAIRLPAPAAEPVSGERS